MSTVKKSSLLQEKLDTGIPEKGLSTREVSEEVCDPSSNLILLPSPLKGMCQHFNKSDAFLKGKKKSVTHTCTPC